MDNSVRLSNQFVRSFFVTQLAWQPFKRTGFTLEAVPVAARSVPAPQLMTSGD
jgi:hypothetical protein